MGTEIGTTSREWENTWGFQQGLQTMEVAGPVVIYPKETTGVHQSISVIMTN